MNTFWSDKLIPNALLRVYQGYGGNGKDLDDAIIDGNLILSGVWLIDEISLGVDGFVEINCRDMAKLLIEQFVFPPLVPNLSYPLVYCRWQRRSELEPQRGYGEGQRVGSPLYGLSSNFQYSSATGDESGTNNPVEGHVPTDAIDKRSSTYYMSPSQASKTDTVYYELTVNDAINAYSWLLGAAQNDTPWMYVMYVSIMEDGQWVRIRNPYTGSYDDFNTPDGIPYVDKLGGQSVKTADPTQPDIKILNRTYSAQRVRFTFTNLQDSALGGYRAQINELGVGSIVGGYEDAVERRVISGGFLREDGSGYWYLGTDGGVYAYGPGAISYGGSGNTGLSDPFNAMDGPPGNVGYWTVTSTGKVYEFGNVSHYGDLYTIAVAPPSDPIKDIERSGDNLGYWLLGVYGDVYAFGSAVHGGNGTGGAGYVGFLDMSRRGTSNSEYWLLRSDGVVQNFGGAPHYGNAPTTNGIPVSIDSTASGNGYYILTTTGKVYTFGDAVAVNDPRGPYYDFWDLYSAGLEPQLFDEMVEIRSRKDGTAGYSLWAQDGGMFNFGTPFYGSLRADHRWDERREGNYTDYSDIVKELLLWSGFWLYNPSYPAGVAPLVFGQIESTGIYAEECIPEDVFDKKPVIDPLNYLREIVGYVGFVDEEGGYHWHSPNFWKPGNFYEDGSHSNYIPEIDERKNLTEYRVTYNDQTARSKIIISSNNPTLDLADTVTTQLTPPEDVVLTRGMVRPLMWVNELFTSKEEQENMAELVASHLFAARRQGQVTCVWNPEIQINDQVRIFERITGETYIHYVRGVSTSHNLETGLFTMTLTTNWLGSHSGDWIFDTDWLQIVLGSAGDSLERVVAVGRPS